MTSKKNNFSVYTLSSLDCDVKYHHWSIGLTMTIIKDGVTIELSSEEIEQLVKALPRTMGGKY